MVVPRLLLVAAGLYLRLARHPGDEFDYDAVGFTLGGRGEVMFGVNATYAVNLRLRKTNIRENLALARRMLHL